MLLNFNVYINLRPSMNNSSLFSYIRTITCCWFINRRMISKVFHWIYALFCSNRPVCIDKKLIPNNPCLFFASKSLKTLDFRTNEWHWTPILKQLLFFKNAIIMGPSGSDFVKNITGKNKPKIQYITIIILCYRYIFQCKIINNLVWRQIFFF